MSMPTAPSISPTTAATPPAAVPVEPSPNSSAARRPSWEVAYLCPAQGNWTAYEYFKLENMFGHHVRVELANGWLEVLPVPTEIHQDLIRFVLALLDAFVLPRKLGKTSFAGIRVRTKNGKEPHFREPDLAFMKAENAHRRSNEFWDGADLLMEVVSGSPDDRKRDYEIKALEYALARVSEYWIIDPEENRIRVLTLDGDVYKLHGDFTVGMTATSVMLPGFAVSVDEAFAAAR